MKTRKAPSSTSTATLLLAASLILFLTAILCLHLRAVPRQQLWTVAAVVFYLLFASSLQPGAVTRKPPLPLAQKISRWTVRALLITSLTLSVAIPWVWIAVEAVDHRVKILAPHLFVMMAQILFEIWSYRVGVSPTIRVGIPVGFVAYRMTLLVDWVTTAWSFEDWRMITLAGTNLAFWSFVLFYVLLIRVCPFYFMQKPYPQTIS